MSRVSENLYKQAKDTDKVKLGDDSEEEQQEEYLESSQQPVTSPQNPA